MKKTMSLKQIEANRNNGRKSNGPKTSRGKAISKMNALNHGILSNEVVVSGLHVKESAREFQSLREQLWMSLAPTGPLEEMLVDRIGSCYWRLRRALTAETGEIALSVDNGCWQRGNPNVKLLWANWVLSGNQMFAMRNSALGIGCQMMFLEEVREDVEKRGELTENSIKQLLWRFRDVPNAITDKLAEFRAMLTENPEGLEAEALKEKHRQLVGDYLGNELTNLRDLLRSRQEREEKEEEAHQAATVLPSADTLDKIMRYETTLERQLYRAMHQLERLQRMRKGEDVPAPLTMELSQRN